MDQICKVIKALPTQGGTNTTTGKQWQVLTFVTETTGTNFPRTIAFEVFDNSEGFTKIVSIIPLLQPGATITVSYDVESREYNGRYYTSAKAWRVVSGAVTPQPAPTIPAAAPAAPMAPQGLSAASNGSAKHAAPAVSSAPSTDIPF